MRFVRLHRAAMEGRASPGPPHAVPHLVPGAVFGWVVWMLLVVSAAGRFLGETLISGHQHPLPAAGLASVLTSVALLISGERTVESSLRKPTRSMRALIAAVAVLSTGGASWLMLANRHSDAPAGSVVAFWTTAFAGLALVLLGQILDRERTVLRIGGALTLVAGAAGVLGNWERPSSFTLLTRFAHEQGMFALAVFGWVAGIAFVAWAARAYGWRSVARSAAAGSAIAGVGLLTWAGIAGLLGEVALPQVEFYAVASAATFAFAVHIARALGLSHAGVALAFVPAALTLLVAAETATGAFGPRPVLLVPVGWAGVALLAGGLLVLQRDRPIGDAPSEATPLRVVGIALATAAVVAGAVGMFAPALSVAVHGLRTSGESFAAEFVFAGFETVGGWLATGLAVAALGLALDRHASSVRFSSAVLAALGATSAAWFALRDTPLHTWVSWIPPEVQQDYGTEYARIAFTHMRMPWQTAAVCAAVASGIILVARAALGSRFASESASTRVAPAAEGDSR